jgi:DNA-binding NarL/FixJ family response regulator
MNSQTRILIVDDNPQDRAFVVRELRNEIHSAEIWEATNQSQLEVCLRGDQLDLVVTDYQLQWSNGIAVLSCVKSIWPDCPVIMFTACGEEQIELQGRLNGLDDYIVKNRKNPGRFRAAARLVLEHAATRKRAEELASRLESLLLQLRVGVFSCNPDGDFLETNHAMRDLFDSDVAEPSQNFCDLLADDPRATRLLQHALKSETPQDCEIEVVDKRGKRRFLRVSVLRSSRHDAAGRIDGVLEDVTEQKRSEAAIRESKLAAAKIDVLSGREEQVLDEVVQGNANKVIARRLAFSEKTVEKHRSSIMKKLQLRSVPELVRLAVLAEKTDR